jgi:hypothetical protein
MKYSHFYTVDQWELRDYYYYSDTEKQMWHRPCERAVFKATTGTRWACNGCYTEPPDPIMDVIFLSNAYRGWEQLESYSDSFYINPKSFGGTISIEPDMFYYDGYGTGFSTGFYLGFDSAMDLNL